MAIGHNQHRISRGILEADLAGALDREHARNPLAGGVDLDEIGAQRGNSAQGRDRLL